MNYDKNALLWIRENAPLTEGADNEWELVYQCIKENLAGVSDVDPIQVYCFLVNEVGYPDVIDVEAMPLKEDAPCKNYFDDEVNTVLDYIQACEALNLDYAEEMPSVMYYTKYDIDPNGLLMWIWGWWMDYGHYQANIDTFERMRSKMGV